MQYILTRFIIPFIVFISISVSAMAQNKAAIDSLVTQKDTVELTKSGKSPNYRWKDNYLNRFASPKLQSPLLLGAPKSVKTDVALMPKEDKVSVTERINDNIDYKYPQSLSLKEYSTIQEAAIRKSILRDFESMQDGNSKTSGRGLKPLIEQNPVLDRIFGGKVPEFNPNGFVLLDLRAGSQFNNNPTTPIYLRRTPIFDFDQRININFNNSANASNMGQGANGIGTNGIGNNGLGNNPLGGLGNNPLGNNPLGNIGNNPLGNNPLNSLANQAGLGQLGQVRDKMQILGNWDTKSAFNFDNKIRLNFKNEPEDILQKIEAGNVSMPVRSQLIPGVQNLMGVKVGLKFGKLDITSVIAQQRSRTQSIVLNGGVQNRTFEIRCDNYEENKHFFLSQFFRENYEKSLKSLPMVTSGVRITRVEVYVTNRTNNIESMRNILGMTDLAEGDPYNKAFSKNGTKTSPSSNDVNGIGEFIKDSTSAFRKVDNAAGFLDQKGFTKGVDYDLLRGAKRLTDREFTLNPELGYISLFTQLRNDEVLAVSYEYTYNGKVYKVGELTENYNGRKENEVIILKLLKSSSIRNRLDHPMWNLMMKNIYSLTANNITRQGFQLRVIYKDDATGMDVPYLQEGNRLKNKPLISIMNLDKLNANNDAQPDGNFDYVENVTIEPKMGKLIFPVLEPFGSNLERNFDADEALLKDKYVFNELYRTTSSDAQQINTKNKFFIKGSVQSSNAAEIQLPLGASGASVRVYAGGVELKSGADYQVDPQLGRIKITNQSVLNSSRQIRIEWETPDLFQTQIRTMFGTRLDYTIGRDIRLGSTFMSLKENTVGSMTRAAVGNEPVNNKIIGFDINYKKDSRFLTRMLDKLPFIQTKEVSSIKFTGEYAKLIPGVNNTRVRGNSMIDDFEAARTINDMTRQPTKWRLGSTPNEFKVTTSDTKKYGYNFRRAKISAYTIDQSTYIQGGSIDIPEDLQASANSNIYERAYIAQDIFKGRSNPVAGLQAPLSVLDISYFPRERGMYNYNTDLDNDGRLLETNARKNFGAVMRGINFDNDFDNSNVEYLEFWLLDPFAATVRDGLENKQNSTGGKLLIHLGDVSEDVIPDNRNNFENGLGVLANVNAKSISTDWGFAPALQYMNDAFDNQDGSREKQDVGLDGMNSATEKTISHIKENFLDKLNVSAEARQKIENDPSADDFKYFVNAEDNAAKSSIITRFKNYLGMENNTPLIKDPKQQTVTPTNTALPDKEDINGDNTINDNEAYHEYEIDLRPGKLVTGNGYIVDKVEGGGGNWYLFRVPIRQPTRSQGGITGFKSIRFMRMVMTDFEQPVVMRFAALQMVANQYRVYTKNLVNAGLTEVQEPYDARFKVGTIGVEDNGCDQNGNCDQRKGKIPYMLPPGFIRDRDANQQTIMEFNEQSISMNVTNLRDGDARAVFKNTKLDLINYKNLKMFVHLEKNADNQQNVDKKVGAFVRIGTDTENNYYEVELPSLRETTDKGTWTSTIDSDRESIWPTENEIDIPLDMLKNVKVARNMAMVTNKLIGITSVYEKDTTFIGTRYDSLGTQQPRSYKIRVVGNPDLSNILTIMLGIKNPKTPGDESPYSFTVWMDELRTNGYKTQDGSKDAAIFAADIKLADIATVSLNGSYRSFGFGGVQDKISERARDDNFAFGVASNIEVDKLLPDKWGFKIPLFVNYDILKVTPHFDPLDPDVTVDEALNYRKEGKKYKDMIEDVSVRKGFNLSNVRKMKVNASGPSRFYDIENLSFTYIQNSISKHNILLDQYLYTQNKLGVAYQFQPKAKIWEPFKNNMKLERPGWYWLKDFNFSPMPSMVAVRTEYNRMFTKTQYRNDSLTTNGILPNFERTFFANRFYDLQWNLSKSMLFTYGAVMNAVIDEPYGEITKSFAANLLTLGRAKNFEQKMQTTWRIPLDKIPFTDWIMADGRYLNTFKFQNPSYGLKDSKDIEFGNIVQNGMELGLQGKVDFIKLYNKFRFLREANTPTPKPKRMSRAPGDDDEILPPSTNVSKKFTRLLMTVRGINFNYSLIRTTVLPGFLQTPKIMGLNDSTFSGGFTRFVLGSQNDNILERATNNNWLTKSLEQYSLFIQTKQKRFDYSTNLEPFKEFKIQIKGNMTRGDSYQTNYRYADSLDNKLVNNFSAIKPVRTGNFSMSFWSFKTAFISVKDTSSNYFYKVFDDMIKLRAEYAKKLNDKANAPENIKNIPLAERATYDINSQDVLVNAFIAAYSGRTNRKIDKPIDPLKMTYMGFLPLPNWRIDYSGLNKLPVFSNIFTSLAFTHSYTSTYTVGNYTSALDYGDAWVKMSVSGYQYAYDTQNGDRKYASNGFANFSPVFIMSTITMSEKMSPLAGINFVTKSQITGRVEYNRERTAALNLSNLQIAEYHSHDFVFGLGFKKKDVKLPFRSGGKVITLKNDLNFQLNVTIKDIKGIQRRLNGTEQTVTGNETNPSNLLVSQATQGSRNIQVKPQIQYQINKRVLLNFYIEWLDYTPFTSLTYKRSSTIGGLNVRFNLSE